MLKYETGCRKEEKGIQWEGMNAPGAEHTDTFKTVFPAQTSADYHNTCLFWGLGGGVGMGWPQLWDVTTAGWQAEQKLRPRPPEKVNP